MQIGICTLVNTGEDVVEVGQVKADLKAETEEKTEPGVKIGIMYSRVGLFWLDIWRWDKKYVLFTGDSVYEIPEATANELSGDSISKPFTLTIPPGLIVLLVLGVGIALFAVFSNKTEDEATTDSDDGDAESPPANG